jgi:hypothetical protein
MNSIGRDLQDVSNPQNGGLLLPAQVRASIGSGGLSLTRLINSTSVSLLAFSFLGLAITIMLVYLTSTTRDAFTLRQPVVGTVFSIVCLLGILAGIYPSRCSTIFHFKRVKQGRLDQSPGDVQNEALRLRGHHPNCGRFDAHVFKIGRSVFCAGCIGLILGAVLSILGTILCFFLNLRFVQTYWLFWIGCGGVVCGLLQYHLFSWGKSSIHLTVNTYFVFGVFLVLAQADRIAHSTIVDLYIVALSMFWLYTRIMLSKLDHRTLCETCPIKKCEFTYRKSAEED